MDIVVDPTGYEDDDLADGIVTFADAASDLIDDGHDPIAVITSMGIVFRFLVEQYGERQTIN